MSLVLFSLHKLYRKYDLREESLFTFLFYKFNMIFCKDDNLDKNL